MHESASVTGIFGTPATATAIWWYRRSVDLANLKRMGLLKPIVSGRVKAMTWKRDDGGLDKMASFRARHE